MMGWRIVAVWQVLVPLVGALLAAVRVASSSAPTVIDLGPTAALTAPALLLDGARRAVIWHPGGPGALFAYADLAASAAARPLLPYPGPAPVAWHVLPATEGAFHLIWHARDGRLRSALLAPDGTTLRGPVDLTPSPVDGFAALPYRAGQGLALTQEAGGGAVTLTLIDAAGRPRRVGDVRVGPAERFAAGIDAEQTVHLAWISRDVERGYALQYATVTVEAFAVGEAIEGRVLHRLDVGAAESISSLALGLDATHVYILTGAAHGARPDEEALTLVSFPIAAPDAINTGPLALPDPLIVWPDAGPLNVGPDGTASLRWPQLSQGGGTSLHATVAVRTAEGWRPAVIAFRDGAAVEATLAPNLTADTGPAVAAVGGDGATWLVAGALHGGEPRLMVTASHPARLPDARSPGSIGAAARRALPGLSLALAWLAASTLALAAFGPQRTAALPFAAVVYWAAKHLLPPDLLAGGPALLEAAGLRLLSPGADTLIALLTAAAIAALGYRAAAGRIRPLAGWLVYAALDAALTWLVFGANAFA